MMCRPTGRRLVALPGTARVRPDVSRPRVLAASRREPTCTPPLTVNGAESLLRTLVASGVEVCFANPGTSEMHFVSAVDRVDGMRPVLGLFEGVVTAMADGYARMAERPAATLLHLGPGLANGLANLHNARRAASPIVNIVGDHATYHAQYDAPLTSDIVGFARPVSGWLHSSTSPGSVAADGARAVQAARQAPGQIATLIVPADVAWLDAERPADPLPVAPPSSVSVAAVAATVAALRNGRPTAILLRGASLRGDGLVAAGRIAAASGARLFCDTFAPRLERGAGRVVIERLPYFAEQLVDTLASFEQVVLVGSTPPVAFFAYPGKPSWCSPDGATILHLAHPHEDGVGAFAEVADALGAPTTDTPSPRSRCRTIRRVGSTSSPSARSSLGWCPRGRSCRTSRRRPVSARPWPWRRPPRTTCCR